MWVVPVQAQQGPVEKSHAQSLSECTSAGSEANAQRGAVITLTLTTGPARGIIIITLHGVGLRMSQQARASV